GRGEIRSGTDDGRCEQRRRRDQGSCQDSRQKGQEGSQESREKSDAEEGQKSEKGFEEILGEKVSQKGRQESRQKEKEGQEIEALRDYAHAQKPPAWSRRLCFGVSPSPVSPAAVDQEHRG